MSKNRTAQNVSRKLIEAHLESGEMSPGSEIALRIDQTLTQDATGTLVMQELEGLELDRARTEVSVQYVDHNLLQTDEKNAEDHDYLRTACARYGLWYSKPGNGVSHPTHMQRFGIPGKTMVGSDSHTPAAGSLGMLAIGVGGLEVALAIAGHPLNIRMPEIWGVRLEGELPQWCSAKDVILEMLRRHDVKGGVNRIIEYHGPGLAGLTAMDRHVIANMGAELGATTSVFPSDDAVREFLAAEGREDDWIELLADDDASYDVEETIDLSEIEPLIAKPSSPGNVVPVREVAGEPISQVVIGSSANPGLRDFAIAAAMVADRQTVPEVSFDINPTSREILTDLTMMGATANLVIGGARIHQAGCMGCIGMGQAPATGSNSLRTMPRNFPGRSGTTEDSVWLCSPETATASALTGVITDPRDWAADVDMAYPELDLPQQHSINTAMLVEPPPADEAQKVEPVKGPNISSLPELDDLPDEIEAPVLLKLGDNISTDEISPAGARALPFRSNIPKLADFSFTRVDETYPDRAREAESTGHVIVGGDNYGQGSSREHAAIAPRHLGLRIVIAKSFARIHWQNLANFGVLAVEFDDESDYDDIDQDDVLHVENLRDTLESKDEINVHNVTKDKTFTVRHRLSARQIADVLAGGLIPRLASEKYSDHQEAEETTVRTGGDKG
ncbi:aconitate hydratase [Gordonia bronchialis DSM 43247]|uniref:Aconitate hydratase n=1 Tax=Gordonia bronchialis (strain ATCC 25592 / DSM 43247 / BCRC 13721 / JCM 3198 / KCTC 3076 / NBRC 16047 / NCTC 10667) TaxID=526226 RepID=D0L8D8_GORB4|nr:aconitate hydratase [Gordonia bronchialis]ACY23886.1 aconitate hydratase [Gordonia bronchialis DSM 43247]MCC3322051.1 aconitate hydratase [Gordonia bronchialis]QGS22816.1 aconitate hydratase [Gordonia bronchialis]UAK36858.1 aconitate hydratase [Gordonia bronchialis]STQ66909.1 2,3-dimethylmalate dehydratase large subunit [Gordonia bronchialis]